VERKPELLTHPIVRHSPLHISDSLYGGRTEALRLHHKIAENEEEKIQYCDVMSLYPYICKYFEFQTRHPVVHVGDACKDIRACLQLEGLIKCTIVPPTDLYHPVLPSGVTRSFCTACVGRAPLNKICEDRVIISPTPKARSVAIGSWTRYEWPSLEGLQNLGDSRSVRIRG